MEWSRAAERFGTICWELTQNPILPIIHEMKTQDKSSTRKGSCLQWRHGNDLLPSDRRNESGVKTSSCAVHQAPGSWRWAPWRQQQLPSSSPSAAGRGAGAQPRRLPGASEGTSLFQSLTFHKHFIYQKERGRTHSVLRWTATCTAS